MEVCSTAASALTYELELLEDEQENLSPRVASFVVAPGRCTRHEDAVASAFGLDEGSGTIRLTAPSPSLLVVGRTYNDTPDGTYGTSLGASSAAEAAVHGEHAVLVHLAQSASDADGYRTNLELLNVTDLQLAVEIALYSAAGGQLGTLSLALGPFEYSQETKIFRRVTRDEVADGYAVIRTTTAGGALLAAASLTDNRTGDTTTIGPSKAPTSSEGDDWYPVLARDGSFMIFVSFGHGGYGSGDLYITRFADGEWQPPQNMGPNVNSNGFESAPYLSPDDRTLYFTTNGSQDSFSFDLYSCPLDDGVAGPRVRLPSSINAGATTCCPVISPDGNTLYMCSDRDGGFGYLNVWMSRRVGGIWQPAVNLGAAVNTQYNDSPRWLSDDGATLIIDSNRRDGIGGFDLWSTTKSGGNWLAPVNLVPPINSSGHEQGPGFLGNDGAIGGRIYFGSSRAGGYGGLDIWYSDFGVPLATGVAAASGAGAVPPPAVASIARGAQTGAADQPGSTCRSRCCGSES